MMGYGRRITSRKDHSQTPLTTKLQCLSASECGPIRDEEGYRYC